jgi:glycosyltransferase involved in cell wall biosynthesis
VSDIPQIREVVDESCAVLVPAGDPAALAEAIASSLTGAGPRARADAGYARFVEHFTIDAVARQMLAFYGRALDRR